MSCARGLRTAQIGSQLYMHSQIKGGPLLQKQLVHNATIANIVPRWQTFEATQFELQVTAISSAQMLTHMPSMISAAACLKSSALMLRYARQCSLCATCAKSSCTA